MILRVIVPHSGRENKTNLEYPSNGVFSIIVTLNINYHTIYLDLSIPLSSVDNSCLSKCYTKHNRQHILCAAPSSSLVADYSSRTATMDRSGNVDKLAGEFRRYQPWANYFPKIIQLQLRVTLLKCNWRSGPHLRFSRSAQIGFTAPLLL